MHAYTALFLFGIIFPVVFIIIPLVVENILSKK
jgi:hypothetical protein